MTAAGATPDRGLSHRHSSHWLISPAIDLVCLSNWGWLLALWPGYLDFDGESRLQFWQVYFLTTPHRWITLALVGLDPERRGHRECALAAWAVGAALVVGGAWTLTGAFTCLALADYLWNAWHFAAQHAGILRIYARRAGGLHPRLEVPLLRGVVVYVALRLAGWTTGWTETVTEGTWLIGCGDVAALGVIALLGAAWLGDLVHRRPAKAAYGLSVAGLYGALLMAVVLGHSGLVARLTTASAVFHALEYLTLVTHYAEGRRRNGEAIQGWSWPALALVGSFALGMGLVGFWAAAQASQWWLGLNLWAAGLHYAYDGMIWKLRDGSTAAAVGAVPLSEPHSTDLPIRSATSPAAPSGPLTVGGPT